MKKYEPEIFDIRYDWDDDKWDLFVYVKSRLLNKDDIYKKRYDNEQDAEEGKKKLIKKLAAIKDGKVEETLIEFGMKKWTKT
jgi:hypothetical protein